MIADEVLAYYQRLGETTRLSQGTGRLEYLRTRDILARTLPPAPAELLDVGGATGAYAGPLAAEGYRVRVVDPVPEHVAEAAALPGVTASLGDARALDAPDGSVDGVLLLGPLYHLTTLVDRQQAWREAGRVARPGAPLVGAVIQRFAAMFDGYARGFAVEPEFRELVTHGLDTGLHGGRGRWFTTAYFHHPAEIEAEVRGAGLTLDRVVLVESAVEMIGAERVEEILDDPQRRAELLDRLRSVETEPSLFGSGGHLLVIAHREG